LATAGYPRVVIDESVTIDPLRASIISRAASRQHRKTPVTFVLSTSSKSRRLIDIMTLSIVIPALATRTSSRPCARRTSLNIRRTATSSPTSAWTASAVPPSASIAATTALAPSSSLL
jgi:hypothetical protein